MNEGLLVPKFWGEEEYITAQDDYTAKFLRVQAFCVCSEHRHPIKTETFHVLTGSGAIVVAGTIHLVQPGDTVHIPRNTYHYFATAAGMTLLEISTRHCDDDVERLRPSCALSELAAPELRRALGIGRP